MKSQHKLNASVNDHVHGPEKQFKGNQMFMQPMRTKDIEDKNMLPKTPIESTAGIANRKIWACEIIARDKMTLSQSPTYKERISLNCCTCLVTHKRQIQPWEEQQSDRQKIFQCWANTMFTAQLQCLVPMTRWERVAMVFPSERFFPSGTFEPNVEGNNLHTANSMSSCLRTAVKALMEPGHSVPLRFDKSLDSW